MSCFDPGSFFWALWLLLWSSFPSFFHSLGDGDFCAAFCRPGVAQERRAGEPATPPLGLAVRSICIAVLLFFINCRRRFLCPTIENGVSFFACFFWLSLEMIAFCECVSSGFEGGTAPYHWPPPPQNVFSAGARRAADCIVLRGLLAPPPFRVRQNENAYRLGVLSGWPPPGRVGQRWRISWRMGLLFSVASVSWIFFRPPPLFF